MPRGGKRINAGRKPKPSPKQVVRKVIAETILAGIDEAKAWSRLLNSEDDRISLEALKYLTNRRDGMPPQSIEHKGGDGGPSINVVIKHVGAAIPRV